MSAAVWPPISPEQLIKEEEDSLACELEWLLNTLQETLASLKSGLEECVALLAPQEPGSTLALSSLRSETVKGFVTRVGTRIVKGDISLRLPTLPPPPRSSPSYLLHLSSPLPLPQLTTLSTLLNHALDIIDISTWTGDPHNASFIAGQLKLLAETIGEARSAMAEEANGGKWYQETVNPGTFTPPLPPTLSFHLCISSAALVLTLRTLAPVTDENTTSTLSLRQRLGLAPRLAEHDESDQSFSLANHPTTAVKVREKIRVESQDPSLMAVMAKLSALAHGVAVWRRALGVVMGVEEGGSEGE